MKVMDLSKELGVTNKDLITFFKDNGIEVKSHTQNATDEMIDLAHTKFVKQEEKEEKVEEKKTNNISSTAKPIIPETTKTFKLDDVIPCRSVTPWRLNAVGVDRHTVYHWEGYGDVDYLTYRDLQALRRTEYITKPKIIIEDANLCYQWRRELGDTYKFFLGVEYPEEFFDLPDGEFDRLLKDAPDVVKEVIKTTAMNMIRNTNYPTVQKINSIDLILGTCLKEFL